jgi:S-phase kinase-associated protein 1
MAAADSCSGSTSGVGGGERTVTLVSSDDARFEVRVAAASLSQTVRRMIDEAGDGGGGGGDGIPIPKVDARTLSAVLEYCNKHAPAPAADPTPESSSAKAASAADPAPESSSAKAAAAAGDAADLEWFDKEMMHVDLATLFSLIRAADYLKVDGLLDLTCQTAADMIKDKTTAEIRHMFGIENDFTPEEEEQMRSENAWVYE